jgi:SAM-dependent methyltransferase
VSQSIPMPPAEMRALVGLTDEAHFCNRTGALVFPDLGEDLYRSVFDLGSGCGRLARQLLQQSPRPESYLGIDLHAGMVEWCRDNLTSVDPNFQFAHHDVHELGFNPSGSPLDRSQPLPVRDASASLIIAWSLFTHVLEDEIPYYLHECRRILRPGGLIRSTWFLFDKRYFPMMQAFQNSLYINPVNPTNAVIVDREWLLATLSTVGLTVASSTPPEASGYPRGFQWIIDLRHSKPGETPVIPQEDQAPFGTKPPPIGGADPHMIGLGSS